MRTLLKDLKFGARALWKSPGFTLVAVVSLALGVGANTAIFSLVNTVLLRPLPVEKPERLVSVSVLGKDDSMLAFSYPTYKDYRDRGRDVLLNGHTFRVVGVMPEGFAGAEIVFTPEVWVPMTMQEWIEPGNAWLERRTTQNIFAVGRLKDGVTREQAEASLNMLAQQLGEEYPDTNEGQKIALVPPGFIVPQLRGAFVGFAAVLMGAVALVLLIACVNLANLLLARASGRRKEIAIRLA